MNPELRYYLSVFFKRFPLFVFVTLFVAVPAVMFSFLLPPTYSAQALLLYERSQLNEDTGRRGGGSFRPAEELQKVRQQLLTRQILIDIARDHNVFEGIRTMPPDQIVSSMRANTTINNNTGRDSATFMRVRFEGRSGTIASAVANDYVTRIQDLSARAQRDRSGGTTAFFEQEVNRLSNELALKSAEIVEFKNENPENLPERLNFQLNEQSRLQERVTRLERDIDSLRDRRNRIVLIYENSGSVETTERRSPDEARLANLEAELDELLIVLSPQNPRVSVLQARVDRQREKVAAQLSATSIDGETDTDANAPLDRDAALFQAELDEIDARIADNEAELTATQKRLIELDDSITRTPTVAITLDGLEREKDAIQRQYDIAEGNLARAALEERKITGALSARFVVVENAVAPNQPFSPNRPFIAGAGIGGGLMLGFALIVLLELMNKSIRRPMELTNGLGVAPMATIPYIMTANDRLKRRVWTLAVVLTICVSVPAAMYYIHLNLYPLDRVIDAFIEQFRSLNLL
ncbi:Wzz/FepE/Etk N-terminal domain-containing protein [Actibacterium sp. 188UL27-1]|uniref:GumC family protein n=1 Tax=Actibacterium sp. 188UL27-1 TaxID=2786961 RepID=UPI00195EF50A|nr:Wzz/FepE/Etk N-terminal domain-containing protein [Actibacterium sp. 188UL27-1]MBM7068987.1 hypothetical protein [Actibacterium sp. 188UL27-1]